MNKRLIVFAALLTPVAATAQLNLPAQLTYTVGQARDPIPAGPVPADSEMPPAIAADTDDATGFEVADSSVDFKTVTAGADQAKVRFTCVVNNKLGYVDPVRYPGMQPAGHLHTFFGSKAVSKDVSSWTQLRNTARANKAAGVVSATCPGDFINNSLYWLPSFKKLNALGDGVTRVKYPDLITLYYQIDDIANAFRFERLRPNLQMIFGINMDDPDMVAFNTRVAAANTRSGNTLGLETNTVARTFYNCAGSGGTFDAITQPDGTPNFQCPTDQFIEQIVTSNGCWNGHLRSVDGYSNTIPEVRSSIDGKLHCPLEYPYRLPQIQQIARYSHLGVNDYKNWVNDADAMMATVLGRPVGHGQAAHMDYIYGWREIEGVAWQCAIGIQFPGRTCTPHEGNFNTIGPIVEGGPVFRLIGDAVPTSGGKPIAPINKKYTGAKLSDWLNMPMVSMPGHKMGGGSTHEVR